MFAALVVRRYKLVAYVRSWPNPAVQASIAGCQAENRAAAATGRNRPIADINLNQIQQKLHEIAQSVALTAIERDIVDDYEIQEFGVESCASRIVNFRAKT